MDLSFSINTLTSARLIQFNYHNIELPHLNHHVHLRSRHNLDRSSAPCYGSHSLGLTFVLKLQVYNRKWLHRLSPTCKLLILDFAKHCNTLTAMGSTIAPLLLSVDVTKHPADSLQSLMHHMPPNLLHMHRRPKWYSSQTTICTTLSLRAKSVWTMSHVVI